MKIFAVGMNYIMHNKELDGALYKPEQPVIFTKPDSALLKDGKPFFLPEELGRIDYEAELVVRICRLGKSIPQRFAHRYYDAIGSGVLLYPRLYGPDDDLLTLQELFAQGCCINHTSLVPTPAYGPERIAECRFSLSLSAEDNKEGFCFDCPSMQEMDLALSKASEVAWMRTGDILCIELSERRALPPEQTLRFEGCLLGEKNIDFEVKF